MYSLNRVSVLGRVGKDPEIRTLANGDALLNLSISAEQRWRDKHSGDDKQKTEWIKCQFYGRQAEIVSNHVRKGHWIYVEGRWTNSKWVDKSGVERYSTDVRVSDFVLIGKTVREDEVPAKDKEEHQPTQQQLDDFDDEIPF
jgi:single-strand DNA-binding protein